MKKVTEKDNFFINLNLINPEICHGKPCIKGTRIMASLILEWLEVGKSFEEIIKAYTQLTKEDISAAIRYARKFIKTNS